jgi:hypothetical protein
MLYLLANTLLFVFIIIGKLICIGLVNTYNIGSKQDLKKYASFVAKNMVTLCRINSRRYALQNI